MVAGRVKALGLGQLQDLKLLLAVLSKLLKPERDGHMSAWQGLFSAPYPISPSPSPFTYRAVSATLPWCMNCLENSRHF